MKQIKNYVIAVLSLLLLASLTIQPSYGAGSSKEAKMVEYAQCLKDAQASKIQDSVYLYLTDSITKCSKYKP